MDKKKLLLAGGAAALIIIAYRLKKKRRETFASQKAHEVFSAASQLFAKNPSPSYSEYRTTVPHADAVQFTAVRKLFRDRTASPESIDPVL